MAGNVHMLTTVLPRRLPRPPILPARLHWCDPPGAPAPFLRYDPTVWRSVLVAEERIRITPDGPSQVVSHVQVTGWPVGPGESGHYCDLKWVDGVLTDDVTGELFRRKH